MSPRLNRAQLCPIMIGRSEERRILSILIHEAAEGQVRGAILRGEAGIGKSRLIAQTIALAATHGFSTLHVTCFDTGRSSSYATLLDLARSLIVPHVSATADYALLIRELARLLPDLEPLGTQSDSNLAEQRDPERYRRRLFTVLTRLLHEYATQQPVLVVVDDLHWCDDSSLAALLYLIRHCDEQPIVFVFGYRNEDSTHRAAEWVAQVLRERRAAELELHPLTPAEVARMVQEIVVATTPAPDTLVNFIYALTEGNPFFVEEVVQTLLVNDSVRYDNGNWVLFDIKSALTSFSSIPRTVVDIVQQRVQRLSAAARETLFTAAVTGRRFEFAVLQRALGYHDDQLLVCLKELIEAHFVVEETADHLTFRHALIHQATTKMLLARERQVVHRGVAEAIISLAGETGRQTAYLPDLAYHFSAAGAWEPALEYQQRAAERALSLYAPTEAIKHVTQALEAASRAGVVPPAKVYAIRGHAHALQGDFRQAQADFEQALHATWATSDRTVEWQVLMALGWLWAGSDYTQAGAWFQRASDLAQQLAEPILHAHSLNSIGNIWVNTGRVREGLEAHQTALAIFQHANHTSGMAESHDLLGTAFGMLGDRCLATEHLGQAVRLFRALDNLPRMATSLAMRALQSMPAACETTLSPLRTREDCICDAEEALQLVYRVDVVAQHVFVENALAHTLLAFGEFGSALGHAAIARPVAMAIGHQQWQAALAYCFGQAYVLMLAPEQARVALEAAQLAAHALRSSFWSASITAALARTFILSRDLAAARHVLEAATTPEHHPNNIPGRTIALVWGELVLAEGAPEAALRIAERLLDSVPGSATDQPGQPVPHLLKLKGEALLALGRVEDAITVLQEACTGARERHARLLLWTIHRALSFAFDRIGKGAEARIEQAAALQIIAQLAATIDEATLRTRFERAAYATLPGVERASPTELAQLSPGGLTAREREVAVLIARGNTSRQIAALLVISERTAEVHVSNILGKLGFHSRSQIAAWAVENRLMSM